MNNSNIKLFIIKYIIFNNELFISDKNKVIFFEKNSYFKTILNIYSKESILFSYLLKLKIYKKYL